MTHQLRICCALAALAPAACVLAQPLGSPVPPTVDNPNRLAVSGVPTAARFFHLAATRRVDIAIIADSNGRSGAAGSGHEDAMARAWGTRFPMYATRVEPILADGGWGAATGGQWTGLASPFVLTTAAPFASFAFPDSVFPTAVGVLGEGVQVPQFYNWGLTLYADTPVGLTSNLRYHLTHWGFGPASTGVLNISARVAWPGSIYSNYAASGPIPTSSAAPGPLDFALTIPAGPRESSGMSIAPADAGNWRMSVGPAAMLWQRVENLDRPTGIAFSPLWERGGKSARYTLETMQTLDLNGPMAEWLRQVTRLQSGPRVLMIQIMHGGNDISDPSASLGPVGGLDSSTGAGHEDNIRGIMAALRAWWAQAGNDPTNLFFQLGPYHPRPGDFDKAKQLSFEQAWRTIAAGDPQVYTLAGNMLSTADEFAQRGYLLFGSDSAHLSADGYQAWAATTMRAIDLAICPGDFDGNHGLGIADIFAFINAWFAGDMAADFNYSGVLEVQDIFDFLNAWFAGC